MINRILHIWSWYSTITWVSDLTRTQWYVDYLSLINLGPFICPEHKVIRPFFRLLTAWYGNLDKEPAFPFWFEVGYCMSLECELNIMAKCCNLEAAITGIPFLGSQDQTQRLIISLKCTFLHTNIGETFESQTLLLLPPFLSEINSSLHSIMM